MRSPATDGFAGRSPAPTAAAVARVSRVRLLVAALAGIAALAAFGPASATAGGHPAAVTSRPLSVTFDARRPGPAVAPDFLGLSFEVKSLPLFGPLAGKGD